MGNGVSIFRMFGPTWGTIFCLNRLPFRCLLILKWGPMVWHDLKAAFSLSVSLFVYLVLQPRWLKWWCSGPLDVLVFRFGFPFFTASPMVWVVVSLRSLWLPLWVLLYIFISLGGFDVGFRLSFPCPLSQSASFAFVSRSRWWCQCLQSFSPFCLDGHVSPFLLVGWNWCSHPFLYPNIFLIVWILDGWLVLLPSACLFVCLLLDDMNYLFWGFCLGVSVSFVFSFFFSDVRKLCEDVCPYNVVPCDQNRGPFRYLLDSSWSIFVA